MAAAKAVFAGRRPTGECVKVTVTGTQVEKVVPIADDPALPYILPVLVDLQHNGALGTWFNAIGTAGPEKLTDIATFLRRHGVGRCLMTVISGPVDALEVSLRAIDQRLTADADLASLFFGIFHEGIFISPLDGWRGAHGRPFVQPPSYELLKAIDAAAGGRIRVVNVAPEEPGGLDLVARAVAAGKIVSLGHCFPPADVVREAVARGATFVTHFGNGAAPQIPRFKNPYWAYLDQPQLKFGLICDGFHLPKEVVSVAFRCKGRENCFVVSDAAGLSGCPPGVYEGDGERQFEVEKNGRLCVANSEILAGAWFQLDRGVEFLVREVGLPFVEAWAQCSTTPARLIGVRLPELAAGEEASFVLARWANDGVAIEQSVHRGKAYLRAPVTPVDCTAA